MMTGLEAAGSVVPKAGKDVSPHLARLGAVLGLLAIMGENMSTKREKPALLDVLV